MVRACALVAAAAALCVVATGTAQRRPVVVRDVPVENPEALHAFHHALRELRAGNRDRVRVLHWGDSNVAADLWTSVARRRLQAAFGDGGAGYLVPPPWGSRFAGGVLIRGGRVWHARRYGREYGPMDGLWGLAGVAVEGAGRGATLDIVPPPSPRGAVLEVHAVGRPRGGGFTVAVDGGPPLAVDTAMPHVSLVTRRIALPPGIHRARLRVTSARPVRLLGIVLEQADRGVVYDVLGINGLRVSAQLEWNEQLLHEQLAERPADLVVLGYGGNEALDIGLSMERYEAQLSRALERIRRLTPNASCLVVSPVAMCPANPRNMDVTAIQRRLAPRWGCAFWHTAEVSGGHGSLCDWIRAGEGMVSRDRLHLGRRGYELMGQRFTDALLREL